jgi:hypothetical protein
VSLPSESTLKNENIIKYKILKIKDVNIAKFECKKFHRETCKFSASK